MLMDLIDRDIKLTKALVSCHQEQSSRENQIKCSSKVLLLTCLQIYIISIAVTPQSVSHKYSKGITLAVLRSEFTLNTVGMRKYSPVPKLVNVFHAQLN